MSLDNLVGMLALSFLVGLMLVLEPAGTENEGLSFEGLGKNFADSTTPRPVGTGNAPASLSSSSLTVIALWGVESFISVMLVFFVPRGLLRLSRFLIRLWCWKFFYFFTSTGCHFCFQRLAKPLLVCSCGLTNCDSGPCGAYLVHHSRCVHVHLVGQTVRGRVLPDYDYDRRGQSTFRLLSAALLSSQANGSPIDGGVGLLPFAFTIEFYPSQGTVRLTPNVPMVGFHSKWGSGAGTCGTSSHTRRRRSSSRDSSESICASRRAAFHLNPLVDPRHQPQIRGCLPLPPGENLPGVTLTRRIPGDYLSSDEEGSGVPVHILTHRAESPTVHLPHSVGEQNVSNPPADLSSLASTGAHVYEAAPMSQQGSDSSAEEGLSNYKSPAPSHQTVSV